MTNELLIGKNILIVEDNAINQMLVKYAFAKSGANAIVAENGSQALELMNQNKFDAILMDIYMPELDGYQTTDIIRNQLHSSIPIIAMTALAMKGEEEKCLALGMNGYISKPFSSETLFQEIKRVLEFTEAIAS
ncbi:MAG: response regulator [Chitinophagaceae bacterium]|nr:response regulator [Chitinophagaceae bacterium]